MIPDRERTPLSAKQLQCLRMCVSMSSKEIAQELGCSPHTVDDHIKEGMRRLGARRRYDAAAIVLGWPDAPPQDWGHQPRTIAAGPETDILDRSFAPEAERRTDEVLREVRSDFQALEPAHPLTEPAQGGVIEHRRQSPAQVMARIVALTVGLVIILSAAEPIGKGFEALARLILHLRSS